MPTSTTGAASYFASPASASLAVLFGVMLIASVLPRYRGEGMGSLSALLLAILAYALLRGLFFLVFLPFECILFSSSVVLAHILVVGIPFTASRFPAKQGLLAAVAVLLFITNGAFIVG
jgi:GNAT superfamily N-acetyltransferase